MAITQKHTDLLNALRARAAANKGGKVELTADEIEIVREVVEEVQRDGKMLPARALELIKKLGLG
jgi:uncharacterized protein YjhX (UPF0386 family)